ncbi:hypothetical protein OHV05_35250 (plasmid) [Kitasatospora sp. NBC_00070]|uniref:hypothetical protein n=1 Tax=Kitasatospora sp. NBC_00070 TaxID=2975962 RepID=UPI002F908207
MTWPPGTAAPRPEPGAVPATFAAPAPAAARVQPAAPAGHLVAFAAEQVRVHQR